MIIGEGEAGKPSYATWALVEVAGLRESEAGTERVFKASAGGKTLLNERRPLDEWFHEGKLALPPSLWHRL
jgi:hypothetical protein